MPEHPESRHGWLTADDGTAYPPGPWHLRADMFVSVLRVPIDRLVGLADVLPAAFEVVPVRDTALVGLAAIRYLPGGVLTYDELLVSVLSMHDDVPQVTIPQIWVTSPESRAGGGALWGIPKELARISRTTVPGSRPGSTSVRTEVRTTDGTGVARLTARVGGRLSPVPAVVPLPTAQRRPDGTTVVSQNSVRGTLRRLAVRWDLPEGGPLGHLAGIRPVTSVAVQDATVVFGRSVAES